MVIPACPRTLNFHISICHTLQAMGENLCRTWVHKGGMTSLAMVKGKEPELWLSSSTIWSLLTLGKFLSLSYLISETGCEHPHHELTFSVPNPQPDL